MDQTKSFDTVPRELLWKILRTYGVPENFRKIIQLFHSGKEAKVFIGGRESPPFPVQVGVKQGEVLAQVLFNLYISVVMKLLWTTHREVDGVQIEYR